MNGITGLSRRARDTDENVTDFTNQGCGFRQYSKTDRCCRNALWAHARCIVATDRRTMCGYKRSAWSPQVTPEQDHFIYYTSQDIMEHADHLKHRFSQFTLWVVLETITASFPLTNTHRVSQLCQVTNVHLHPQSPSWNRRLLRCHEVLFSAWSVCSLFVCITVPGAEDVSVKLTMMNMMFR